MEKRKREMKLNIPMCAACILLCLTLITTHMTGGLYAKYTASGAGSDSARVAKFNEITISETGDFGKNGDVKALILPGVNLRKKAVVNFPASEVGAYVFVEYSLPDKWLAVDTNSDSKPDKFAVKSDTAELMSWSPASSWSYLTSTKSGGQTTYVFYRRLAPGIGLNNDDLIKNSEITVSEDISKNQLAEMTGIYIDLRATVVQAGDFDSADTAWVSIVGKGGH
ncbi:MAG: hypothetical protein IKI99_04640 [Firmicutes bacterium]|nr:hypothetical protein [Bacillota bacterium]